MRTDCDEIGDVNAWAQKCVIAKARDQKTGGAVLAGVGQAHIGQVENRQIPQIQAGVLKVDLLLLLIVHHAPDADLP